MTSEPWPEEQLVTDSKPSFQWKFLIQFYLSRPCNGEVKNYANVILLTGLV